MGSGTTLLWLIRHMADGEITWVVRRFAGEAPVIGEGGPSPGDTLAGAVGFYRQTWRRVDAIAFTGRVSLDELCRRPRRRSVAEPRWVLMHLLEETATPRWARGHSGPCSNEAAPFFSDAFARLRAAGPGIDGIAGCPFVVYYGEVSDDSDGPVELCRPVAADPAPRSRPPGADRALP